jgi:hypothetical protein
VQTLVFVLSMYCQIRCILVLSMQYYLFHEKQIAACVLILNFVYHRNGILHNIIEFYIICLPNTYPSTYCFPSQPLPFNLFLAFYSDIIECYVCRQLWYTVLHIYYGLNYFAVNLNIRLLVWIYTLIRDTVHAVEVE